MSTIMFKSNIFTFLFTIFDEFKKRMGIYNMDEFKDYVNYVYEYSGDIYRELSNRGKDWLNYQLRFFGFLSERLVTLYIYHNFPLKKIKQVPFEYKE